MDYKKVLLLLVVAFAVVGCGRIETGNVGVRTDWNKKVIMDELSPGFYTSPLSSVTEFVTKETELILDNQRPKAKDNLTLDDMDISLFYTVNPLLVAETHIKYANMTSEDNLGLKYPGYKLVERISRGVLFDTVARYDSLTLHTKRGIIENDILQAVQAELDDTDPNVFNITKVVIKQVTTDSTLEESIRAAVQMQKETERKVNENQLAQAEADRLLIESRGRANAIKEIAEALTPEYIQYMQIQVMGGFAKDGTHTVVLPSGINPLVSIK